MPLLEVKNLVVRFSTPDGDVEAVNGVDFSINEGETLGIVGESGSGKSQTAIAIMGLIAENGIVSGEALFLGRDLLKMSPAELNEVRGDNIAMIFQDPMTSLNPYMTIEQQMVEVLRHHRSMDRKQARARAIEMLKLVSITDPERLIKQYPHEYSGGMQQRVMIAMGLLCSPALLIADEPATALDVTVEIQIKNLMREIREKSKMAVLLISHDLSIVAGSCNKVIVMYAGRVMEYGTVEDIFYRPQHPYTLGLLRSVPRLDRAEADQMQTIPGNPPNLQDLPAGCPFQERCEFAHDACSLLPELTEVAPGQFKRCHLDKLP